MINLQNLKPQNTRTKEEQREIARKGGIASGKARKEKKLVSDMVRSFLEKEHVIKKGKTLDTEILLHESMVKILLRGGAPAVALIKVMSEVTEGAKLKVSPDTETDFKIIIQPVKPLLEENKNG